MFKKVCYIFQILILLQVSSFSSANLYAQEPYFIRVGIYNVSIDENFSEFAVTEAVNLWMKTLKDNSNDPRMRHATVKINYFKTLNELYNKLQNDTLEFLEINSVDFFNQGLHKYSQPYMIPSQSDTTKFEKYLLLGKSGNVVENIAELKNTTIFIPSSPSAFLMEAWIKVYLKEKLGEDALNTIQIVNSNQNESTTLLSVFFGKRKFAIVRNNTFNFSCEMNPQLKKKMKILATSEKYISIFLAQSKNAESNVSKSVFEHALNLTKTAKGRQMLDIIQIGEIFSIEKGDLNKTEELLKTYEKFFN